MMNIICLNHPETIPSSSSWKSYLSESQSLVAKSLGIAAPEVSTVYFLINIFINSWTYTLSSFAYLLNFFLLLYILMIYINKYRYIYMCICMHICIQVHICVQTHTHTHFKLHQILLFRTVNIHLDLPLGQYFQNLPILCLICFCFVKFCFLKNNFVISFSVVALEMTFLMLFI